MFIEIPASKLSFKRRKPVFGIGINDADYFLYGADESGKQTVCPYYFSWKNMLRRCYDSKLQKLQKSYVGCIVSKDWLTFTNFKQWMISQKWEGMSLDKDIKFIGNRMYSSETCLFVTQQINNLLNKQSGARGFHPLGVHYNEKRNKYIAQCNYKGKEHHIGYFSAPEEAHLAYKEFKHKVITDTANLPENEYIREYLLNHASLLKE